MNEKPKDDILRQAMSISWAQQVLAAGKDPATGHHIIFDSLQQFAKGIAEAEYNRRADIALRYVADCLMADPSPQLTDTEGDALSFLQASLISDMADNQLFLGPRMTALLGLTTLTAYLLGRFRASDR